MTGRRNPLEHKFNVRLHRMIRNKFASQENFVKKAGINQTLLTKVLYYRIMPKEEQIEQWAKLFEVPKEQLQETWNI